VCDLLYLHASVFSSNKNIESREREAKILGQESPVCYCCHEICDCVVKPPQEEKWHAVARVERGPKEVWHTREQR